jgi:hypothetical protein
MRPLPSDEASGVDGPLRTNEPVVVPWDGGEGRRRFYLSDAIILVAAIAVGLALGKTAYLDCYPRRPIPAAFRLHYVISCGHHAAFYCLASLTVAFLPLRLMRPRHLFSRLIVEPGFVASFSATAVLVMAGIPIMKSANGASLPAFAFVISLTAGMTVAMAWGILWFSGCWKREPGWVGGMGLALGASWILMPFLHGAAFLF